MKEGKQYKSRVSHFYMVLSLESKFPCSARFSWKKVFPVGKQGWISFFIVWTRYIILLVVNIVINKQWKCVIILEICLICVMQWMRKSKKMKRTRYACIVFMKWWINRFYFFALFVHLALVVDITSQHIAYFF